MIKLSNWAKEHGISYTTAWRWWKTGKIKNAKKLESGMIVIDEQITDAEEKIKRIRGILDGK